MSMVPIGEQIREARLRAGLTQAELGEAVGVARGTVGGWEKGHRPERRYRPAIEAALGELCWRPPYVPEELPCPRCGEEMRYTCRGRGGEKCYCACGFKFRLDPPGGGRIPMPAWPQGMRSYDASRRERAQVLAAFGRRRLEMPPSAGCRRTQKTRGPGRQTVYGTPGYGRDGYRRFGAAVDHAYHVSAGRGSA